MKKISSFQAVIYNQDKIKDLSSVVCPPYDVISPARQDYFHKLNPYNFIHIILGKDIPGEDKYRRAAVYFKDWIKNEILVRDNQPAIYFYNQQFNIKGEKKNRLGFIALLRLDNKKSSVFGHENTRTEAKEDRLRLTRQVKANLSPIFVVFSDQKRIIQRNYQQYLQGRKPFIDITDDEKTNHKVWRLDDPKAIGRMEQEMQQANVFIADGHHRYEVACTYRDEMEKKLGSLTGDEKFNYVMAYFTNVESRGLVILPINRLVRLTQKFDIDIFKSALTSYFDLEEVKDRIRFFFLMAKAAGSEHVIGLYAQKRYWLIRLKNIKILDKIINDKPRQYRELDVAILNYMILKNALNINPEDKEAITFSHDNDELINKVDEDKSLVAFFLNPVKIEQITSIALAGEKMPAKSTFFYPKVLSGLAISKFD